jgi:F0F1-type ATP synthase membrane subunit b/b'
VGAMEFNSTLFIQAGIYLALFFILKTLYFEPLLALISRREAMTTGKAEQADALIKKTEELRQAYQQKIQDFRFQMIQEKEQKLQSIRQEVTELSEAARKKLEEASAKNENAFESEIKQMRAKFPTLSNDLSQSIVDVIRSPGIASL